MGSKVHFVEVLKANVPEGTRDALLEVARARGEKPSSLIRSAILALVRQGAAVRQEVK